MPRTPRHQDIRQDKTRQGERKKARKTHAEYNKTQAPEHKDKTKTVDKKTVG
jgi:hypothetical protein